MPRIYIKWSNEKDRRTFYKEVERRYTMQCHNIDNLAEYEGLNEQSKASKMAELIRLNELLWEKIEEEVFNTWNPKKKTLMEQLKQSIIRVIGLK